MSEENNKLQTVDPNTGLVQFGEFGLDDADDVDAAIEKKGGLHKLREGATLVRVPPPRAGEKVLVPTFQHFVPVTREGKTFKVMLTCARLLANKPCVVCNKAQQLEHSGNPLDHRAASDLNAAAGTYMNMVIRGFRPKGGRVPQMVDLDKQEVVKFNPRPTIVNKLTEMRRNGVDFTHPLTGFDVVLSRVGTNQNDTKYSAEPRQGPSTPLHVDPAVASLWISSQPDLREYTKVLTEQDQRDELSGKAFAARRSKDGGAASDWTSDGGAGGFDPPGAAGAPAGGGRTAQDDMEGNWG